MYVFYKDVISSIHLGSQTLLSIPLDHKISLKIGTNT